MPSSVIETLFIQSFILEFKAAISFISRITSPPTLLLLILYFTVVRKKFYTSRLTSL